MKPPGHSTVLLARPQPTHQESSPRQPPGGQGRPSQVAATVPALHWQPPPATQAAPDGHVAPPSQETLRFDAPHCMPHAPQSSGQLPQVSPAAVSQRLSPHEGARVQP